MRWVDVAILVVIAGSAFYGLSRGLIVQAGAIIGSVLGLVVGHEEYRNATNFLALFFHRDAHLALAAYIILFVIIWIVAGFLAQAVRGFIKYSPLAMVDRAGGAILGLLLGILAVEILLLLAKGTHDASLHHSIASSRFAPVFEHAVPGLHSLIPKRLPGAPA